MWINCEHILNEEDWTVKILKQYICIVVLVMGSYVSYIYFVKLYFSFFSSYFHTAIQLV